METLGRRFAEALAAKDEPGLRALLADGLDFRGLTPNRFWEASTADETVEVFLGSWFEPSDEIRALESVEDGAVGDRERVAYRFRVTNPDGTFVVEQQAYYGAEDGRIGWLRILCSGFRAIEDDAS